MKSRQEENKGIPGDEDPSAPVPLATSTPRHRMRPAMTEEQLHRQTEKKVQKKSEIRNRQMQTTILKINSLVVTF